ncbi:MAG: hypothetical protein NC914_02765 [Candidatus Omnitrophica bacterium]|nr:hypothetical protein [Candidatus Omnitrophota bacterium]
MSNIEEIKRRFLKNTLPMRLGCIAADLSRLKSFSRTTNNRRLIKDLIEEAKFFIEWSAPKASLEVQEKLVNLQIQLALCGYSLNQQQIVRVADKWSKEVLALSGLVKKV